MSKKNTPFDAFVQFNADKRGIEFRFDNEKREQIQSQNGEQKKVPKTFRKKELTQDQPERRKNSVHRRTA
jgi:hypothetical protein